MVDCYNLIVANATTLMTILKHCLFKNGCTLSGLLLQLEFNETKKLEMENIRLKAKLRGTKSYYKKKIVYKHQ